MLYFSMSEEDKQRADRLKKLESIREAGIDPFGQRFPNTQPVKSCLDLYDPSREDITVTVAGRIMTIRKHGKAAFLDLHDTTGKIQIYLKKNLIGEKLFNLYELLDLGDIIGVKGKLFKTKTGEITIMLADLHLLSKSLRPLPEKWHGLKDVELRYRKRYLDLIVNPDVKETFLRRTKIIQQIRNFLYQQGFIEVETPMMQSLPGGATARPFITHHHALDMDLYLRIAPELYLKRLLVGGMDRVYEINRNFRNEGISTHHNPEFTMLEIYQAYGNYHDMMELTEKMVISLVQDFAPELKINYGEIPLDLTSPWPRKNYLDLFQEHTGIDWHQAPAVLQKAKELGFDTAGRSTEAIANDIFEKLVEPHLTGPIFVTDYPTAICPLTKAKPDQPAICERFELFMAGMEMANAFTELNDPMEQRLRFEQQLKAKTEGAIKIDEDFINALEYGMPPAGGLGIGIDRLVMILTNSPSIRDVILFPTLREIK